MTDADRQYFVALMAIRREERAVRIAAYGLMSNHFHLVAVRDQADAVSLLMMDLNGLYATYRHVTHRHTGRVWQGRFYSAILGPGALGYRATVHRTECRAGPDGGEGGRWGVVLGARPSGLGAHAGVARHARVCAKLAQRYVSTTLRHSEEEFSELIV